jgi:hypothetical protein
MDIEQNFIGFDDRAGDVFQHQGAGGTERFAKHGFHRAIPFPLMADKVGYVGMRVNQHDPA